MAKFAKRLRKLSGYTENALVIGQAFGYLEPLLEIYTNVFVIDHTEPSVKARNLIYKQNCNDLNVLTQVGAIFIDLDKIDCLESLVDFWQRHNSTVFVQGNDCIPRHLSKPLFKTNWQCTSLQGIYHVWEKIK